MNNEQARGPKHKLAVVRLRGDVGTDRSVIETLKILGLRKINSYKFLPDTSIVRGMLQKCNPVITWGEVDEGFEKGFDNIKLKPPKGGFASFHHSHPRGDLGYRGDKIKALVEKMSKV
ncbi:MAG: uL30 family ribosomal protein [Candidatus Aenigmarchaeota archaeon]|nr:uL30 family ribosomal protein [Candidatus Aenigmarchaeota archaeon]